MAARPAPPPAPSIWLAPPSPARRPGLDRGQIVGAAIEVADEGGVAALTMAAVSARLGSYTAMALYRYVGSKDGLIDLMLDQVTGEVVLPDSPGPSWRADLRAIATSSWSMVMRHRWYAQLVHARPPLGPNMLRRTEAVLEILTRQGATLDDAMTYAALLDRHVFGGALQAAEEQAMLQRYGLTTATELAAAVVAMRDVVAAGGAHPLLSRWMASPATTTPDEQFELSLTFLLDGIARRLPRRASH